MDSLRLLSCLLDYPDDRVWQEKLAILSAIAQSQLFSQSDKANLTQFVTDSLSTPLLDAQSQYSEIFDNRRQTSLLLFEHVHGDSRERGQAMVDLLAHYHQAGLEIEPNQLPDYLPIFLEFLSIQTVENVQKWLSDIAPILKSLELRLQKLNSHYAIIFTLLYSFAETDVNESALKDRINQEESDNTPQYFDKIWQDEQIRFMDNPTCHRTNQQEAASIPTYYVDVVDADRRGML